jgi:aryl-alcohol dehydrogenase-like predicted oxidoreductase
VPLIPSRDYIDNLFLWGPSIAELKSSFIWDELNVLKQSGKIIWYGVNTHDHLVLTYLRENQNNICLDDIMLDYNLLQLDREALVKSLANSGVKIWAGTALCQGFLNQSLFSMIRRTRSFSYLARALFNPSTRRFLTPARTLRNFTKLNFPQYFDSIPFSFVLQNPSVSFVPVGMLSCSSITRNLQVLNNQVPLDVLKFVSSWARLNSQVQD